MNIISSKVVAKLSVAFVAVAMLMTLATPAKAQSATELQQMINDLLAQVASLQAQLGGSGSASAGACTFTRSLTIGSQGSDVTCLQNYLTATGHFTFSGGSTGYFGPVTQSAVAAWQAANGVSPAVGYFGPISQAKYASLTASMSDDDDDDDDSSSSSDLEGGAGAISDADWITSLNNEEVGEDEEDVEVAGLTIEADDGSDIELVAVTLNFSDNGTTNNDDDLDEYAEEVSVWFDGEEVARLDADEFEDDDNYQKTVSLDRGAIIRADDEAELVVAVSGISNLDSSSAGDTWDVEFESVRFRDAQGAVITDSSTGDIGDNAKRIFSFETFGTAADTELKVSKDDDDINDARVIQIDDNSDTDDVEILSFTIEIEGDSDVTVDDVPVFLTTSGFNIDDGISGVSLMMDGDQVGSESVSALTGTTGTTTFDNMDLDLEAGETYAFVVTADLVSTSDGLADGDTIKAELRAVERAAIDAEDESGEDVAANDRTGTALGEAHTLYETAFNFELTSTSASKSEGEGTSGTADVGTYTFKFDLTAFGGDIWVEKDTCVEDGDQSGSGEGISYYVTNPGNNTSSCSFTAPGVDTDTSSWLVEEGTTETFNLTVAVTATSSDFASVYLESINWSSTASSNPSSFLTAGLGEDNTSSDELYLRAY